jgi:hypothetical protein
MPVFESASVDESPEVVLSLWSIRESADGRRFFVGCNDSDGLGRVSTAIQSFDPKTRIGMSLSGRRYVLVGRGGWYRDGEYIWNLVVKGWELGCWTDVTPQLCPDWRLGVPASQRDEPGDAKRTDADIEADDRSIGRSERSLPADVSPISGSGWHTWRAKAYLGEYVGHDSMLSFISQIEGEVYHEKLQHVVMRSADETLQLVSMYITLSRADNGTVPSGKTLFPEMTIFVEQLESPIAVRGELVARIDLLIEESEAHASLLPRERPRIDLGPVRVSSDDSVWDVVGRLLDSG